MKVGLIDYGASNLCSVHNALETAGADVHPVTCEDELDGIEKLIFPGQGTFAQCCQQLEERGLFAPIAQWLKDDRPYFGICLGYQLLFEESEEAPGVPGFGVLEGKVVRFDSSVGKVPHMGWNEILPVDADQHLWNGLSDGPHAYFVHSFYPKPSNPSDVASNTQYGASTFASSVARGNLVATQFHPEKSQEVGLTILKNFLARGDK